MIRWDQAEGIGWQRDGTAITLHEPVSVIPAHSIETGATRSRFVLI